MDLQPEPTPSPNARAVGTLYLLYFVMAALGAYLGKGIVVAGDATLTASNILAHGTLYRAGYAVGLAANVLYIALTVVLYRLFRPVNPALSLLAACFGLVGCAVLVVGGVFQIAPEFILGNGYLSGVFSPYQLQAATRLSLDLYAEAFRTALVLFALFDILIGHLIFRSRFLPRALGVLMMAAGLGWLTELWPAAAHAATLVVLPLGALAEIALMLWLLVKGVDVAAWRNAPASAVSRQDRPAA